MVQLESDEPIEKGKELFINYGQFSDLKLFTKYGFVSEFGTNLQTGIKIPKQMILSVGTTTVGSYADWDERKPIIKILVENRNFD